MKDATFVPLGMRGKLNLWASGGEYSKISCSLRSLSFCTLVTVQEDSELLADQSNTRSFTLDLREGEIEREREEREKEREKEKDGERQRETERDGKTESDREQQRHRDTERDGERQRQTEKERDFSSAYKVVWCHLQVFDSS